MLSSQSLSWAGFRCPGGCGESILLSLNQKQHPSWAIASPLIRWGDQHLILLLGSLTNVTANEWVRQGILDELKPYGSLIIKATGRMMPLYGQWRKAHLIPDNQEIKRKLDYLTTYLSMRKILADWIGDR